MVERGIEVDHLSCDAGEQARAVVRNAAQTKALNAGRWTAIKILNNVIEQGHRSIKRIIRPMTSFKNFYRARIILSGIETCI